MDIISKRPVYSCTLIIRELMNKSDVQLLIYNYVKILSMLGAVNISASIKRDSKLAYPVQQIRNALFVEIVFQVNPKAIKEFNSKIKLDSLILRSFLVKN